MVTYMGVSVCHSASYARTATKFSIRVPNSCPPKRSSESMTVDVLNVAKNCVLPLKR